MSALKTIIKCFTFEETERAGLTLGAGARLNPTNASLELSRVPGPFNGDFSTAADITVLTKVTNPLGVKQWLGFEAAEVHFIDEENQRQTRIGYRLSDGADQFYWNGAAWVVNTTLWNSEEAIAANISTFPVTSRSLGIVVNLVTDLKSATPSLNQIKVLYSTDTQFQEDLIFRSLVPALEAAIRPCAPIIIVGDGTDLIDLGAITDLETPYDIVDVVNVYDETNDPDHLVNILASYDTGTKVITLTTGALASGDDAWINFLYKPLVTVQTSQDFTEVDKLPSIVLENIAFVDATEVAERNFVVNKADGSAVIVPGPIQGDLEITIVGITEKNVDQHRLADQIKDFFGSNRTLRSVGLDEVYRLWLIDEYEMRTSGDRAGVIAGRAVFRIAGALNYHRPAQAAFAVQRFSMEFFPEGEDVDEVAAVPAPKPVWAEAAKVRFELTADNPSVNNRPEDRGPQALGEYAVGGGAPVYVAPKDGLPGFWRFDSTTPDFFDITLAGIDDAGPACMLFLVSPELIDSNRFFTMVDQPELIATELTGFEGDIFIRQFATAAQVFAPGATGAFVLGLYGVDGEGNGTMYELTQGVESAPQTVPGRTDILDYTGSSTMGADAAGASPASIAVSQIVGFTGEDGSDADFRAKLLRITRERWPALGF